MRSLFLLTAMLLALPVFAIPCVPMEYAEFKDMTKEAQVKYYCDVSKKAAGASQVMHVMASSRVEYDTCMPEAIRLSRILRAANIEVKCDCNDLEAKARMCVQ